MNNPKWCNHSVVCPITGFMMEDWCQDCCSAYKKPEIKTVIISEDEIRKVAHASRASGIYGLKWERIKSIEIKVEK